jgi:hypothetical protein
MKITETQIRQVIKEEIQNVLNENEGMHDEEPTSDPTSLGLTAGKLAGMFGGAVSANALVIALEKLLQNNPQVEQAIRDAITNGGQMVQSFLPENKKRK